MYNNKGNIINSILIIVTIISAMFLGIMIYSYINEFYNKKEEKIAIVATNEIEEVTIEEQENIEEENVTEGDVIQQIEPVSPTIITSNNNTTVNTEIIGGYYYNQLDEYSKIIYNALQSNLENMKTGTYSIQFNNEFDSLLKQENGSEILNHRFQVAWDAFYYDKPDVFYLDATKFALMIETTTRGLKVDYKVYIDNGDNASYLQDPYNSKEQINSIIKELEKLRGHFKSQMLNMSSKEEQIKALHDWIVDNVEYDIDMQNINRYTIYGALMDRKSVCEGYAKLFKYILDSVGIESVLVSGTATNSDGQREKHMWNYVNLDGTWYGVDCTWDDPIIRGNSKITDDIKYKYFLKGRDVFYADHTTEPITENNTTLKYPEL